MITDTLAIGTRIREGDEWATIESLGPEDATRAFAQQTYWVRWDEPMTVGGRVIDVSLWWEDNNND